MDPIELPDAGKSAFQRALTVARDDADRRRWQVRDMAPPRLPHTPSAD